MWLLWLSLAQAGELDIWRARAALAGGDLYAAMGHIDQALTQDPADWEAHQLFRQALEPELPWLLRAVYRGLAADGSPEQQALAQLALGEAILTSQEVEPSLLQLVRAQHLQEHGQDEAALALLESPLSEQAQSMRLSLLSQQDLARTARREGGAWLKAHPEHPEQVGPALQHRDLGVLDRGLQSALLSNAGELLSASDPVKVYRAHALYLALGERELALAAAARLEALQEPAAVAAHRPWSDSMARDVGRLLAMQKSPRMPEGATPQEQARALAWAAREKARKGNPQQSVALWAQLLDIPQASPPLVLEALLSLEQQERSPQQLLLDAEKLRVRAAMDPLRQPEHLLQQAWLLTARSHRRLGQLQHALAAADLAAALGAGVQALVLQGEILEQLGEPQAAFFAYAEAASLGAEGLDERLARCSPMPGQPSLVVQAIPQSPQTGALPSDARTPDVISLAGMQTGGMDLEGQWTVLFFWASWCAPCMRELPEANALAGGLQDTGVQMVAVSLDDRQSDAQRYWSRAELEALDWSWDTGLGRAAQVQALPTIVVVSPDGLVVSRRAGYEEGQVLAMEAELRSLMDEQPTEQQSGD